MLDRHGPILAAGCIRNYRRSSSIRPRQTAAAVGHVAYSLEQA
jgi:hypothetical protein